MASTNEEKRRRRRRRRKHPFLGFLVFVAIVAGIVFFLRSEFFSIETIDIEGNKYYTPSQIQDISGIQNGMNIFFEVKSSQSRKQLLDSPYIKSASIQRVLPSTIKISVEERMEYAAIEYSGSYAVIDKEGMVLRISSAEPELTLMEGIEVSDPQEGKPLDAKKSYLFRGALELLSKTEANDLYFKKIYFSSAIVRAYIYDDYYCEGTPEAMIERMPDIKTVVSEHFVNGINKGVIKVVSGTDILPFDPKID